ncbi:MAG: hypothetical protein FWF96_02820 [Kiritimatiellaeota bacterium]|nr:hypothetical protein [Kiritimatiellota bacterium]
MLLLAAGLVNCPAEVVFQLDARKGIATTESNLVWRSLQGIPVTAESDEWQRVDDAVVNVAGAMAGPLMFDAEDAGDAYISSLVMVVRCAPSLRMRETLVCGEAIFRLGGREVNDADGNTTAEFERGGFCEVASWKIDGVAFAPLEAGKKSIVEVHFSKDLSLVSLGLGSDTGRKAWRRGFGNGEAGFMEVIGFSEPPSDGVLAATYHLLARKWELDINIPLSTDAQRAEARASGVNMGSFFATIFMIR